MRLLDGNDETLTSSWCTSSQHEGPFGYLGITIASPQKGLRLPRFSSSAQRESQRRNHQQWQYDIGQCIHMKGISEHGHGEHDDHHGRRYLGRVANEKVPPKATEALQEPN